jgi:hypothetical protein
MPLTTVQLASEASRPPRLGTELNKRVLDAALRARRIYPGPVGELLCAELLSWQDFGYRLGGGSLVMRVVADIAATPEPDHPRPSPRHRGRPIAREVR